MNAKYFHLIVKLNQNSHFIFPLLNVIMRQELADIAHHICKIITRKEGKFEDTIYMKINVVLSYRDI